MHIKWATNLTIVAKDSTAVTVTSQPVRLPPNNSLSMVVNVEYIVNITGNTAALSVTYEYSNDGVNWYTDTSDVVSPITTAGTDGATNSMTVAYEFVRVRFGFDPDSLSNSGTGIAAITLDADGSSSSS